MTTAPASPTAAPPTKGPPTYDGAPVEPAGASDSEQHHGPAAAPPTTAPPTYDGVTIETPPDHSFMEPAGYFSEKLFDLEQRVVFPRSWVFAADLSMLQEPGDYVTETVGREPVVVVRDRDGGLRAFLNVCPHRASTLAEGAGNCGRRLVCPYHGWTFELDGRLVAIPRRQGFASGINPEAHGLREVAVDVWEQFVFVNVSGDAPPLSEWLHPLPEQLAGHGLSAPSRVYEIDDLVDSNWKIMMDNAFCDYHLEFVHAESIGAYADPASITEELWDYTGRLTTRWTPEQLSAIGVRPGLTGPAAVGAFAYSVFPNWFIAVFPNGGASVMWWTPVSLRQTRARVWNYSPDPDADHRSDFELLKAVQREDYAICEKVQQGLASRLYRPGPQHYLELRIRGFQQQLMTMLSDYLTSNSPNR